MKKSIVLITTLVFLFMLSACQPSAGLFSPTLRETVLSAGPLPLASAPTGPVRLSAQEAKEIALAHAGFSADEVTGLHAEYDRDEIQWEVEFWVDGWEYDYEIQAETGRILSFERDR